MLFRSALSLSFGRTYGNIINSASSVTPHHVPRLCAPSLFFQPPLQIRGPANSSVRSFINISRSVRGSLWQYPSRTYVRHEDLGHHGGSARGTYACVYRKAFYVQVPFQTRRSKHCQKVLEPLRQGACPGQLSMIPAVLLWGLFPHKVYVCSSVTAGRFGMSSVS